MATTGHNAGKLRGTVHQIDDDPTFAAFDALPPDVRRCMWACVLGYWSPFDAQDMAAHRGPDFVVYSLEKAEQSDMRAVKSLARKAKVTPLPWQGSRSNLYVPGSPAFTREALRKRR